MRLLHLANAEGRDTRVAFGAVRSEPGPVRGVPGRQIHFKRYLATTERGLDENLQERFGEEYGQALVDGDPEIDIEAVGRPITETSLVWLTADGEVMHAPPEVVEIIQGPDGQEKERRAPVDNPGNVNDELPIKLASRRVPKADAVRRFVFTRTQQIQHVDGLTFDFLYALARDLHDKDELAVVGGGPKGRDPLTFQTNGTPWRGFLEGRVDGDRFLLLLHLSNMELKRP